MNNYLNELNEEQKLAVETTNGPVLIIAGAGTGKTKTLTYRMLHLINSGVEGDHILGITFTNKAAAEMRERMKHILPHGANLPILGTFHSICSSFLRKHASLCGFKTSFTIISTDDQISYLKDIIAGLGLSIKEYDPKKILGMISNAKNNNDKPDDLRRKKESYVRNIDSIIQIWNNYETQKKKDNVFDFDDLLIKVYEILLNDKEIRLFYQKKWEFVHVDEYQDTNVIQYLLVNIIAGEHKNLCVVGDSDQSIYSWRGATIKNILNFERDYKNAITISLKQNYRSTPVILEAAQAVIEKNTERIQKILLSQYTDGEKITLLKSYNETMEASNIIEHLVIEHGEKQIPYDDMALLYRANFQSRALEEACLMQGVPYQVLGIKFFDRKEVKDIISYLKLTMNLFSSIDIKRVINTPTRGIGKVSLLLIISEKYGELSPKAKREYENFVSIIKLITAYTKSHTLSESIEYIFEKSGYEAMLKGEGEDGMERIFNVKELITYTKKYDVLNTEDALATFLDDYALLSQTDDNNQVGGIRLMTIHASKGLEFDTVCICGLEEGLFPSINNFTKKDEREEERRLMYVAITRAKRKLFLSHAQSRRVFGDTQYRLPSEYISDIPDHLIDYGRESESMNSKGQKTQGVSNLLDWDDDSEIIYFD